MYSRTYFEIMEVSKIIYYTRQNEKSRTLSLRDLCLKETYDFGLQAVFYAVRDSDDVQDLLAHFQKICLDHIEFECEEPSYIRFNVVDAYDNINYLKFKKAKKKHAFFPDVIKIGA